MKTIIKIFFLYGILVFAVCSCEKESLETLIELAIDGKQKVITVEQNGIGIEFYLLNEEGQPATVFEEGENFIFHLAITNNIEPDTAMYIIPYIFGNPDLFKVFSQGNNVIGKPWKHLGCNEISEHIHKIKKEEKFIIKCPWTETRVAENSNDPDVISFYMCYYSGLNREPLSKGTYYTKLTQPFCLGRYFNNLEDYVRPPYEYVCTDTLTLKINFEIK